ncbi:MAG: hypothetical protein ACRD3K_07500 [Edaphobacter sp.]
MLKAWKRKQAVAVHSAFYETLQNFPKLHKTRLTLRG